MLQYEIAGFAVRGGYTSFGKEHAKGNNNPSWKNFFNMANTWKRWSTINSEYLNPVKIKEVECSSKILYYEYKYFEKSGAPILQAIG